METKPNLAIINALNNGILDKKKVDDFLKLLSNDDKGIIACSRTRLFQDNPEVNEKLHLAISSINFLHYKRSDYKEEPNYDFESFFYGASIMYQIMSNPEFLKDVFKHYQE